MHDLTIIGGAVVEDLLRANGARIPEIVAKTYLLHSSGRTVNPDSHFLRFPNTSEKRIIALPAAILDSNPVAGIKWIASFPTNLGRGLQRASAIIVLNDIETGHPVAVIEGAQISACRTACSAALALRHLRQPHGSGYTLGIVGAGHISRKVVEALAQIELSPRDIQVHDKDSARADVFAAGLDDDLSVRVGATGKISDAFAQDVVLLATTAGTPYIREPQFVRPGQIVLNLSLRDMSPEIILCNWNIVDDIDHCLKANTSPHLAELVSGSRDFIAGTLADLMNGAITPDRNKGLIFSPFGLGILDLALARLVYEAARENASGLVVGDFFANSYLSEDRRA